MKPKERYEGKNPQYQCGNLTVIVVNRNAMKRLGKPLKGNEKI